MAGCKTDFLCTPNSLVFFNKRTEIAKNQDHYSARLNEDLKFREVKPAIVNQQCLVYQFQCNLCDAGYVGYARGHLHERALMDTNRNHRQFVNIILANITRTYHLFFQINFTCSLKVLTNLIA